MIKICRFVPCKLGAVSRDVIAYKHFFFRGFQNILHCTAGGAIESVVLHSHMDGMPTPETQAVTDLY